MQTASTFCMQQQQDLQSGHLLRPNYKGFFVLQIPQIPILLVPHRWQTFVFNPHKHYTSTTFFKQLTLWISMVIFFSFASSLPIVYWFNIFMFRIFLHLPWHQYVFKVFFNAA